MLCCLQAYAGMSKSQIKKAKAKAKAAREAAEEAEAGKLRVGTAPAAVAQLGDR